MRPHDSKGSGRRSGRGPRRSSQSRNESRTAPAPSAKKSFWQKLFSFFKSAPSTANGSARSPQPPQRPEAHTSRKPEAVEVTSTKLYVGNLSYAATESDLLELFNGVGAVKNAEVVTHNQTERSKGFGFVTMTTIEEAKRAVIELHDKAFMGRKMVVSGAKTGEREPNYRG